MNELLQERRKYSEERLNELKGSLATAQTLLGDKGCIYVTGSFARGEASEFSDLDVFILSDMNGDQRRLSQIDGILIKAELINQARKLKFPEFSGDGKFLEIHSTTDLIDNIGEANDDYMNTLTARLLMILESNVLFDHGTYEKACKAIIDSYWIDFKDNKANFIPGFLVNDILRLWRTFCINYEAVEDKTPGTSPDDPVRKAKRKLKNYKLKHSRLLTCFSAVAYLLKIYEDRKTVTPEDAWEMVQLTPTERLQALQMLLGSDQQTCELIQKALYAYERFLEVTGQPKKDVLERFKYKINDLQPYAFGDCMYEVMTGLGGGLMQRIITI